MTFHDPLDRGAKGDGQTLDTTAIQTAIDEASGSGGGTVILRAGRTFISGSLVCKSNVILHVEAGCTLKASTNWADITERWPGDPTVTPSDGAQVKSGQFLAAYRGTENIGITGFGVIDGSGHHYHGRDVGTSYDTIDERPFLLFWVGVKNVNIQGVTLRDSACWTLRLSGCEDVWISGVRIKSDMKMRNADGIDLDRCRKVRISDCDICCADDAISLKSCREFPDLGATEDIVVANCTLRSRSSALVVGVDSGAPIRNVTFTNCVIRDSNRGLSVNLAEEAVYENILFTNMIVETKVESREWWGKGEPIYISATRWFPESDIQPKSIRNVRFNNILCRSECGVYIACNHPGWIDDVTLDNVRVTLSHWSHSAENKSEQGTYDNRPNCEGPELFQPPEGIAGFHLQNASNVTIMNSKVVWEDDQPYWGNALWARGCDNLHAQVQGVTGRPDAKAIDIA